MRGTVPQSMGAGIRSTFTKQKRKPLQPVHKILPLAGFQSRFPKEEEFAVVIDLFFFALTLSGKERLHLFEERLSLRHYILLIQFSQLPQQLYLL